MHGIRRLEDMDGAELRADISSDLRYHDQRLVDLRAADLATVADRLDGDPRLQRTLATKLEFVSKGLGVTSSLQ